MSCEIYNYYCFIMTVDLKLKLRLYRENLEYIPLFYVPCSPTKMADADAGSRDRKCGPKYET